MTDAQKEFHDHLSSRHLGALWVGRDGVDLTRPTSPAVPHKWAFDALQPDLETAGEIVTAEEAFRRVLVLENPAFPGEMRVTNALYAGVQLVRPGEIAPCHRHSQTALRFILSGEGAYTTVDGERAWMAPGDFIITPSWAWHDHANEGEVPVTWLDVLDTPLVGFFDTVFRENFDEPRQPITMPDGTAPSRFGANMRPVEIVPEVNGASPVFHYPYKQSRTALETLRAAGSVDPAHGIRLEYINPQTGTAATPTMGACLQFLPAGFSGQSCRSTDGILFCGVEGKGRLIVDDQVIEWGPRDLVVVPGWHRYRFEAEEDSVLFSASDRPAQEKLGLWRGE